MPVCHLEENIRQEDLSRSGGDASERKVRRAVQGVCIQKEKEVFSLPQAGVRRRKLGGQIPVRQFRPNIETTEQNRPPQVMR